MYIPSTTGDVMDDSAMVTAELIRRMDSPKLAELVVRLCEDNMGSKLVAALQAELQDESYRS